MHVAYHARFDETQINHFPNSEEHIQGLNPEHLDPIEIISLSEDEEKKTSIHLLRICSKYMNLFKGLKENRIAIIPHNVLKLLELKCRLNENQSGDVPYIRLFSRFFKTFIFIFSKKTIKPLN